MKDILPWLLPLIVSLGVGGLCTVVAKVMPREKLAGVLWGWLKAGLIALKVLLLSRMSRKAADQFEESILVTLFFAFSDTCVKAIAFLREDNEAKTE